MKIYIAGPMSGHPAFNIPAFDEAAAYLRTQGFEVISPAEVDGETTRSVLLQSESGDHTDLPPSDGGWSAYLARDFMILADDGIDAIVRLPGWETSRGARLECLMGAELGIALHDYVDYDPILGFPGDDERAQLALYGSDGKWINHEDNPLRQRSVTGGVKDNRGKPRVDLLPFRPLLAVGRVLGFGAAKYKPHNWRLGLGWSDTIGSALRHVFAFADGEDIDPESGECHVDNAICQLLFLSEYYHTKTGTDDRWAVLREDVAAVEAAKA